MVSCQRRVPGQREGGVKESRTGRKQDKALRAHSIPLAQLHPPCLVSAIGVRGPSLNSMSMGMLPLLEYPQAVLEEIWAHIPFLWGSSEVGWS